MRTGPARLLLLSAILLLAAPCFAQERPVVLGIDRSKLSSQDEATRERTLADIRGLHAVWFRDVADSGTPQGIANFVDVVRLAKQNNLRMIANIVQIDADYPDGNAGAARNKCGWNEKRISAIDLNKFRQRLQALLGAIRAAGLPVDAFEIGNEDDTYCYNADIPNGHYASQEELATAVRGYARFLQVAAETIRDPHYFPAAKIVTFGIAHGSDKWDRPPHHLQQPARFIAMLHNVDGVDYLRYVDGYGTHLYASPNNVAESVTQMLREDAEILGRDKPMWVTEWGFLKQNAFPNTKGQSLSAALEEFLHTLGELHRQIPMGPALFYSYNGWLAEPTGNLLPPASVISGYAAYRDKQ